MIGLEGKTIKSERLTYRLLQDKDKKPLAALLRDEEVTRPAGFLPAKTEAEFDEFFYQLTQYNTGVAVVNDDSLIGYFHVNKYVSDSDELKDKACVGVGFVIGREYQKKGYGTEMLMTMTDYLMQTFSACFADRFYGNEASQITILKCGYQFFEKYTMHFEDLKEENTLDRFMIR